MQGRVQNRFSGEKLSNHRIYTMTHASSFDYQWWMDNNWWCSVDAHSHEGARSVSLSFFPMKAANTLIIYWNDRIAFDLPDSPDKKSSTLHWRSISEFGTEHEACCFADKASQYRIYQLSQPFAKQITNDARPKFVDTQLTLISPWAYPQYVMIYFAIIYHQWYFGSLCTIFIYFLLHQNIVL